MGVAGGVGNALGKAVTRANVPLSRALDIWAGLLLLPIRQVDIGGIPPLITLAVKHDLPVYDRATRKQRLRLVFRWRRTTTN